MRKLARGRARLTWAERDSLSHFIALHEYRVPYMRSMMDDSVKSLLEAIVSDVDKKSAELNRPLEKIQLMSRRGKTEVSVDTVRNHLRSLKDNPQGHSLRAFVSHALNFSRLYRHMKWNLYEATGKLEFVTSDCPVIKVFPDRTRTKAGIVREDFQLWFPVTRKHYLIMTHDIKLMEQIHEKPKKEVDRKLARLPEIRLYPALDKDVLFMNETLADHATRWVFSGHVLPWLVERLRRPSENLKAEFKIESGGYRLTSRVVYGQTDHATPKT